MQAVIRTVTIAVVEDTGFFFFYLWRKKKTSHINIVIPEGSVLAVGIDCPRKST